MHNMDSKMNSTTHATRLSPSNPNYHTQFRFGGQKEGRFRAGNGSKMTYTKEPRKDYQANLNTTSITQNNFYKKSMLATIGDSSQTNTMFEA